MSNDNGYYAIFEQDGKASTPSGSNSRSKKPAAKRSRQETPSAPHAPLAIEAPPPRDVSAITSRLNEIELTMRKYLRCVKVLVVAWGMESVDPQLS
jgi:hypothetical protein